MLILARRKKKKIRIGEDIVITIIEIHGDQVKIGVEAPKTVKVFRQEVFEEIQKENKAAAAGTEMLDTLSRLLKNKR